MWSDITENLISKFIKIYPYNTKEGRKGETQKVKTEFTTEKKYNYNILISIIILNINDQKYSNYRAQITRIDFLKARCNYMLIKEINFK